MLRVGLTGGIACGKSRVRRHLAAAGIGTLDLDAVAHEMIAPGGPAYEDVVTAFGRSILAADGTVDRKVLGARVFGDAAARAELNALVHPRVRDEEARRAAAYRASGGRVFVTDAALLVEAGFHLRFDRLVVVDCEGGEQLRRLVARDRIEEAAARARIAAQMPAAEKRRFAHIVLDASGSLEATDVEARRLAERLLALADPPPRPAPREATVREVLRQGPEEGPRGLDPVRFATGVGAASGMEMERLKRLLVPPFEGPWLAAASEPDGRTAGPEALAVVVGLWSLMRRGLDPEFTASAMFSAACLTHRDDERTAGACLLSLAAARLGAGLRADEDERRSWTAGAEKWARHPVPSWAHAIVDGARRDPPDGAGAREAAHRAGIDPRVADALVACVSAVPEGPDPTAVDDAARALRRGAPLD
ncbi:MAG TPA: dephospho-CoA kinase [Vicinamibacteria bacterium]|nr:dephospho-CoA kinase [Vicinamibacteria bacterium]